MITPVWIVGFSGHREVKDPASLGASLTEVLKTLKADAEKKKGRLEFYGSAAAGADTLAAKAAESLGIPVHLVLPMPEEKFKADFYSVLNPKELRTEDWARAKALIDNARANRNGGTLRLARGSHLRVECYYDAGLQVLEASDLLLAVVDPQRKQELNDKRAQKGHENEDLGGAQDIVDQAEKMALPVISMDSSGSLTSAGESLPSLSASGMEVVEDLRRQSPGSVVPRTVEDLLNQLDGMANAEKANFRLTTVMSTLLHGAAALIAATALIFDVAHDMKTLLWLALVEFILVFVAWFSTNRNHKHHTHERWLRARFATELVRSIKPAMGFMDPLIAGIERHEPDWRRFAVSVALLARREMGVLPAWKVRQTHYVNDRLEHQISTKNNSKTRTGSIA